MFRTTKKEIDKHNNVFVIEQYELQNYLRFQDCVAYTYNKCRRNAYLYKIKECNAIERRMFLMTFYICTGKEPSGNLRLSPEAKEKLISLDNELLNADHKEIPVILHEMTHIFLDELNNFYIEEYISKGKNTISLWEFLSGVPQTIKN